MRKNLQRCDILLDPEAKDEDKNRCKIKPTEQRLWANNTVHLCPEHADEWDTVVTAALTMFGGRNA